MVRNVCAALIVCLGIFSTTVKSSCPRNYQKGTVTEGYGSYCYTFHKSEKKFGDAEKECVRNGGILASIHSGSTNRFLVYLMYKADYRGPAWIGLNDKEIENRFQWLDGSVLDYQNWGKGEGPRTTFGHDFEDCVALSTKDIKWHDFRCPQSSFFGVFAYEHPFICQTKMPPTTIVTTTSTTRQKLTTKVTTKVTTPPFHEETSKLTDPPIPEETSKPTDPPIPEETSKSTDLPIPEETSKPTDPPIPEETSKPTDPPIPEETSKPTDPPIPEETSKSTDLPIPEETSKPTDPPIPEETSKPTDPPIPEETSQPTDPPLPEETSGNTGL